MLRYPCLVLDHDDTTVDSTRKVNYPQFQQALKHFRPGLSMTFEEYLLHCFNPGFYEMCEKTLHYTPSEMDEHLQMWKEYHRTHSPDFFPGMPDLIRTQKERGGYLCVVSHSSSDVICAVYERHNIPVPDLIYGAEQPPDRRKPNPWPIEEIMRKLRLEPNDLLMVDDMPLGGHMAHAAGVKFVGAGWCDTLPEIKNTIIREADYYFSEIQQLYDFLFQ